MVRTAGVTAAPAGRVENPVPPQARCAACGAVLEPDQEWCLECGAARTTLQKPPDWRVAAAIIAVVIVVVVVAVLIALP